MSDSNSKMEVIGLIEKSTTPFMYHNQMDLKQDVINKSLGKAEVMLLYENNYFTVSDLLIAKIAAKYVYSSEIHIKKAIEHFHKTAKDDDRVALISIDEYQRGIKSRLGQLCKADILKRYMYQAFKEYGELRPQSYYFVSAHGYNYIKRIVNFKGNYDEYLAIRPIEEALSYLSVNTVISSFYEYDSFKGFENDVSFYSKDKQSKASIYSIVETEVNGLKYKIYLEPLKFNFNDNRISKNEWKENIIERLEILKEAVLKDKDNNSIKYIMFICEDIKGVQIAVTYVREYLADIKGICLFTTDGVVFTSGLERSIVSIVDTQGENIALEHIKPPFI